MSVSFTDIVVGLEVTRKLPDTLSQAELAEIGRLSLALRHSLEVAAEMPTTLDAGARSLGRAKAAGGRALDARARAQGVIVMTYVRGPDADELVPVTFSKEECAVISLTLAEFGIALALAKDRGESLSESDRVRLLVCRNIVRRIDDAMKRARCCT